MLIYIYVCVCVWRYTHIYIYIYICMVSFPLIRQQILCIYIYICIYILWVSRSPWLPHTPKTVGSFCCIFILFFVFYLVHRCTVFSCKKSKSIHYSYIYVFMHMTPKTVSSFCFISYTDVQSF